ncbi:MAG: SRPBCC family protein [Vicinamibacterales bacterium]
MHLEGQFTVSAPQADVYALLTDPAKLSRYLPDVKEVSVENTDRFTVTARVGVSHIRGTMVMKLEIRDRRPPISTTIVGRGTGLASVVDMVTSFTLESSLDSGGPVGHLPETLVRWQGEVTISGKLAAFGPQGLLDRMARKNIDTFIDGIRAALSVHSGSQV